jgi:hypothetical protein
MAMPNKCPVDDCSKKLSHDLLVCLGHWRELGPFHKERIRRARAAWQTARKRGDIGAAAYEREYNTVAQELVAFLNKYGPDGTVRRRRSRIGTHV